MLESKQTAEHKELNLPNFTDENDSDEDESLPQRPKKSRRRWIIPLVVVLLILILLPIGIYTLRGLRRSRTVLLSNQVHQGNISLVVSATGPVQGTVYNADFVATGRISEIDVTVGQHVNAGQVLAKIDATALQDALNQAQATLQQQKDYGTQDAINIAQDQVNTAQDNLNNATLKAPHAGVVTAINGTVGGTASGGGAAGGSNTGFMQIVDASHLQVQANVNESDIGGVKVGQTVQFTVSAYGSRTFNGTISAISPLGQNASNVVTYPVTINVDMNGLQGANVLPGMTANITIAIANHTNALLVPVDAVNYAQSYPAATSSDRTAALAQAQQMLTTISTSNSNSPTASYVVAYVNKQWVLQPVVLGLSDGNSYEVLAGLSLGETIAVGQQGSGGFPVGTPGTGSGG